MSEDVILFGASCGGVVAFESFRDDHNIISFCDNDPIKWGKTLSGLPIIKPDDIPAGARVIIASAYIGDIMTQLEKAGVQVLWRESMAFADNFDQHMDHCFDEYMNGIDRPILVYHMGKVGSTSFETLVRANGMDYFSFTSLNPRAVQRLREEAERRPIKIVSLVRDPVARDIASLFQLFPDTVGRNRALFEGVSQVDVTTIVSAVLKNTENTAIHWFQKELIASTGIDVYAHEFDRQAGSQRIQQGNIDLLILKLERIDQTTEAVADFLDIPVSAFPKANMAERKWYACLYDEFKNNFRADESYLQLMYDSPYAHHFYTDEEIQRFIAKWRG